MVEEEIDEQETEEPEGDVPPDAVEASLDEILAKKGEDAPAAEEEADEEPEAIVPAGREERVEPLAVKVVPQQPTEFTCKKCFLVKHRSQLADKKRMYCRDCA